MVLVCLSGRGDKDIDTVREHDRGVTATAPATRFDDAFGARREGAPPGLIPYFTAGYPHAREHSRELLHAAQRAGCIAAEVGIPFSDPLADGPTIQRTGQVALRNGMTLATALAQVRSARQGRDHPAGGDDLRQPGAQFRRR